jgi:pyrroline-5-carboxylate reductase
MADYRTIGFIGSGKMASAIIKGLLRIGKSPEVLMATKAEKEGLEEKSKNLGIKVILDNKELVENSKVIFIAVKPNQVLGVLEEIKPYVTQDKLIVSIAAGVTLKNLENNLPENTRVIRVMPNTPALIGEGMSGIVGGSHLYKYDLSTIEEWLSSIGKCIIFDDEAQLDIVTAISGSGPAFFYKVINDIARAGEKIGMDYDSALFLSIQTAIGSAKMAMSCNMPMEELIANVATKGGCTAVGVDCMNENDTQKLFYDVIKNTTEKAHALGQG